MQTQTKELSQLTNDESNVIFVNAKRFLKGLKYVSSAVSRRKWRPALMNVHLKINDNGLTLEATDSHVLTQQKVTAVIGNNLIGKQFQIAGNFAKKLSKAPTKHGDLIIIKPIFSENVKPTGVVEFLDGNGEQFIDSHVDNESFYPDLDRVIYPGNLFTFETRKKELLPILKSLKKQTNKKDHFKVHLEIQDNSRVIVGIEDNVKELKQRNLTIKDGYTVENNHGLNFQNDFDVTLLIRILQHCNNTEFLKFAFGKKLRPFVFTRENGAIGEVTPLWVNGD